MKAESTKSDLDASEVAASTAAAAETEVGERASEVATATGSATVDPAGAAELARIEAETRRFDAECAEIERKTSLSYSLTRIVAASLLILPVTWFYIKELVMPAMEAKNIKLSLEISQRERDLEVAKVQHDSALRELEARHSKAEAALARERVALERSADLLSSEKLAIEEAHSTLRADYNRLSRDSRLSSAERDDYREKYEAILANNYEGRLQASIVKIAALEEQISILSKENGELEQAARSFRERSAILSDLARVSDGEELQEKSRAALAELLKVPIYGRSVGHPDRRSRPVEQRQVLWLSDCILTLEISDYTGVNRPSVGRRFTLDLRLASSVVSTDGIVQLASKDDAVELIVYDYRADGDLPEGRKYGVGKISFVTSDAERFKSILEMVVQTCGESWRTHGGSIHPAWCGNHDPAHMALGDAKSLEARFGCKDWKVNTSVVF